MLRSLSHVLISTIFISGGASAFANPGGRANKVADAGIPAPEQAVEINGAAMVVGGVLLGLDLMPKVGALILLGTLVPTTAVGHAFWKEESDAARKGQLTQFFKNLGLIGALIAVLAE